MHDDGDSVDSQERSASILFIVEKAEDLVEVQLNGGVDFHFFSQKADDELRHRLVELQNEVPVETVTDQNVTPPPDDLPALDVPDEMEVRAFQELGFETKTGDTSTFVRIAHRMMERSDSGHFEGEFTEEMTDELFEAIREDPVVRVPSDFVLVGRVFGLLSGIAHTLGHRANVLEALGASTG